MTDLDPAAPCPGPLVWLDLDDDPTRPAAVLECATCDYVIATGSVNDVAHAHTDIVRSTA